ncbi:MAG: SAM-dependent methyltransferase [Proteobacteria bacterium]|nr:SAM-dependent methyltransferase [Pseudomonadota bacterium]
MSNQKFEVFSIGQIEASQGQFGIKIDEPFISALEGLDDFGFVNIFWWAHQLDDKDGRQVKTCAKPYRNGPDQLGIFATRSPARPNPIALTTAAIISVNNQEGIIQIPYIDADHGTPVLDLKPYHPSMERIKNVTMPDWCNHWPKWYEDSGTFDWEAEFTFV